ncbi:hypothetical protein TNIN_246121 [Trichonephila inaurata madagascariensis]|uniref:Uncharacterized protein n=1 Tax=Trichonephila inaurata madagascariensis TaxID=2747483 RepID=A0A8X6X7U4_9ARAC|nr:hypothetical protein TNIN_246121 [Trichonephila inaurata madagascariensis]
MSTAPSRSIIIRDDRFCSRSLFSCFYRNRICLRASPVSRSGTVLLNVLPFANKGDEELKKKDERRGGMCIMMNKLWMNEGEGMTLHIRNIILVIAE